MNNAKSSKSGRWDACRAAALVACLLLAVAGCGKDGTTPANSSDGSGTTQARQFTVEGMTCEGCVSTLTTALKKVPGVQNVQVSLEEKKATVTADEKEVPTAAIEAAITGAGYTGRLVPPAGA